MPATLPEGFELDDDLVIDTPSAQLPEGFEIDPDPTVGDTLADAGKSLVRGITAENYQAAAEGIYRGAAGTITPFDRQEYLNQEIQSAQKQIQDIEGNTMMIPDAKAAGIAGAQERAARAQEELRAIQTEGTPEYAQRQADLNSPLTAVGNTLTDIADEASRQRQLVREALPVSQEFQQSLPGQIIQGAGQLTSIPLYAVPGVGPAVAVAQTYQEGYDDAINSGATPEQARMAATTYAASAGPIDVVADRLIVGRYLKGLVNKATVGEALKEIGGIAIKEGAAEGAQQLALNAIASEIVKYDPDRELTQDVLNSILVGGIVGGIGAGGAETLSRVSQPTPQQVVKDTKLETLDAAAINAEQNSSPLVAQELNKQANTLSQVPASIVAPEAAQINRNQRVEELLDTLESDQPLEGDERFAPPENRVSVNDTIQKAASDALNLYTEDPDQAGQSSLRDWRQTLPPEIAGNVQAHGAPITELQEILEQGINQDRPFYTAPLNDSGESALGLRDIGTGGQVLVLGAPGQQIKDSGVQAVVVNDYLAPSIPQLQQAYPNVTWLNTQNATQWLNEQPTRLDATTGETTGETQISEAGEANQAVAPETSQEITYGNAFTQSTRDNPSLSRRDASEQAQARNASLLQLASRGDVEASASASTPESRTRFLEEVESVSNIPASEIEQFPVEATGTAEHYVRLDPRTGRAVKVLFPNRNGMFVEVTPDDATIRQGTLPEYLKRVELFNQVFDGDLTIEGTTRLTDPLDDARSESPSLVVSQTWEVGTSPTQEEVTNYMRSLGFQPGRRGEQWYRPEDGIYVADAKTANFVKTDDGVRAIDLLVSQPNEPARTDSGSIPETLQPTVEEGTTESSEATTGATPRRVQIGSSPQTHQVLEQLPQSEIERQNGEQYFRIRNERTGEEQVVESQDMRPVKGKVAEDAIKPEVDATKERLSSLTDDQKRSVLSLNDSQSGALLIPDFQDLQQAVRNIASSLNQAYGNFTDWSAAMTRSFGETVRTYLKKIYQFLNTGGIDYLTGKENSGAILNPANIFSKSTRQPFKKTDKQGKYKPEGIWSAAGKWNKQIFDFLGQKERNVSANLNATEYLAAKLRRERNRAEKAGIPVSTETLNTALGNTDNHLTNEQYAQARQIRNEDQRKAYELTAKLENLELAREAQARALESLPEPIQEVIVEMRNRIDQLSNELRDSGAVSGDIKAAIDDSLGLYLHRSYSIFDDAEGWKNFIYSDDPQATSIRNKAEALFQDYARANEAQRLLEINREAGTPISRQEAIQQVQDVDVSEEASTLLEDYLAIADAGDKSILGGRLPGAKNRGILKMRGQIPQEIRDLWGEQKDATANFAKTYAGMSSFLENHRFLENVLSEGLITESNPDGYIWKEGESPGVSHPRGYTQLVGDGSKTMEPLNGAWMPPELVQAFEEYYIARQNNNKLLRVLQAATGLSMKTKTAYSWASTVRNFFGNIAFMTANGNFDVSKLRDAKNTVWSNLTKGGEKAIRDRIENYIRLGVVNDNVGAQLIREITEASNIEKTGDKLTQGNPILTKIWKGFKKIYNPFDKVATDIYSSVDDFWKVFAFENELQKVKEAFPDETQAQQEQRAASVVRDTVPTYSLAPEIVRNLKDNFGVGFAPFITFTTEVLRTTYNTVKRGINEVKEGNATGNTKLRDIGIKRLASFAATQSFFPALGIIFKQLFDYDDEDEDSIRSFLPDWQKNAQLLLLDKDDKGNPRYIDVSFLDPYGYLKEPVIAAMVQTRSGKSADQIATDATLATLQQIAEPFISEQILAGSIIDVARNTNSSGAQVFNPQDTQANQWAQKLMHVASAFEPGTITSLGRIYKGATGQVSPTGRAYDLGSELSSFTLGQRVSTVDPQTALDFSVRRFKGQNQDATALLNRNLKSRGTIPEGSIVERYNVANESKQRLVQDLRNKYKAALTLGVPQKRAIAIMDDAAIGKDILREVVSGVYNRYEPSTQTIREVSRTNPERITELQQVISETPQSVPLR